MELTDIRNSVNKNIHNSKTTKSLTKIHEANKQVPTENKNYPNCSATCCTGQPT